MGVYINYFTALGNIAKHEYSKALREYEQKLPDYLAALELFEEAQQKFFIDDKAYRESQEALRNWLQETSGQGERPKITEPPRLPKFPMSPKIPRETFVCMGHNDNRNLEGQHLIYERDDRVLPNERCLSLRKDPEKPRSLSFEKDPEIILEEIDCDLIPEWRFSFFFRVPDKSVLSLQNISDLNQECIRELYNLFKEEVLAECERDAKKVNMPLPIEPGLLRISYGQGWQYKSFVVDADKFFEALYKERCIKVLLDGEDICFERIVRYTLSGNLKPEMITQKSNTMKKELQPGSYQSGAQSA